MKGILITGTLFLQLALVFLSVIWSILFLDQNYSIGGILRIVTLLVCSYFVTIYLTHKHQPKYYQRKFFYVMAPFTKAIVIQSFITWLISVIFFSKETIIIMMIALFIYLFFEYLVFSVFWWLRREDGVAKNEGIKKYSQEALINNDMQLLVPNNEELEKLKVSKEVKKTLFIKNKYLDGYIVGGKICECLSPFDKIVEKSDLIFINGLLNNWKEINDGLKNMYQSLPDFGLLVINYVGQDEFENQFFNKFGKLTRPFAKAYYYFFYRGLPKLKYFNVLHKVITGGKRKAISRIEVWGRLMYNGFEICSEAKNGEVSYTLAKKSLTPSGNPEPSFHPVITLNRVSLYGKIIKIHKVRSMYPYSEFLQQRVYEELNLASTGKFTNDPRITGPGKFFRKYWIDELPQFLDWFRGEIKFVGIRAMSQHYFGLYPKEYQDLFIRVKPGIISPIFDEKTDGFDDIVRIEQKYLEKYLVNPIRTDFEYFFITLHHILKGVRSK